MSDESQVMSEMVGFWFERRSYERFKNNMGNSNPCAAFLVGTNADLNKPVLFMDMIEISDGGNILHQLDVLKGEDVNDFSLDGRVNGQGYISFTDSEQKMIEQQKRDLSSQGVSVVNYFKKLQLEDEKDQLLYIAEYTLQEQGQDPVTSRSEARYNRIDELTSSEVLKKAQSCLDSL